VCVCVCVFVQARNDPGQHEAQLYIDYALLAGTKHAGQVWSVYVWVCVDVGMGEVCMYMTAFGTTCLDE